MKKSFSVRTIIFAGTLLLQLSTLCFHSRGAAGDVDLSFDTGFGVNGTVNAVVRQPDGKVIIGGQFTTVKGLLRTNIARLNADGSGDAAFNPGIANTSVSSLALQPDGKVLVGGQSVHIECGEWDCWDVYDFLVIRLDANGSLDSSFNPGIGAGGYSYGAGNSAVVVQADGKVLIGGDFSTMNGTNRNNIARLNADGTLDSSFDPGTGVSGNQGGISDVVVQSDGKVLIGGYFTSVNGTNRNNLARLNADGSLDSSFNPGTAIGGESGYDGSVASIALQPDGKVLAGGYFTNANGNSITRFNANGTLDSSFNSGTGANGI